jgi:hypothetical protein
LAIVSHLEFQFRMLPGYHIVQPALEALAVWRWNRNRRPPAPRSVKVARIRVFASNGLRRVFVETGTFFGDTLAALKDDFDQLYSIELHGGLAERAIRRFTGQPKISIVVGDSGVELEPLLLRIEHPLVVWLDGHYSGRHTARGDTDTPVLAELLGALRHSQPDDVILIDDARLFGVDPAYPTIDDVSRIMRQWRPEWSLVIADDIIQLCHEASRVA